jgi:hypothetical protein
VCVCRGEVEMITLDSMTGVFALFFANCLLCLDTSSVIVNEEYMVLWLPHCTMGLNDETEIVHVLCVYKLV